MAVYIFTMLKDPGEFVTDAAFEEYLEARFHRGELTYGTVDNQPTHEAMVSRALAEPHGGVYVQIGSRNWPQRYAAKSTRRFGPEAPYVWAWCGPGGPAVSASSIPKAATTMWDMATKQLQSSPNQPYSTILGLDQNAMSPTFAELLRGQVNEVFAEEVLRVMSYDNNLALLGSIATTLKPGGLLIIRDETIRAKPRWALHMLAALEATGFTKRTIVNSRSPIEYDALAKQFPHPSPDFFFDNVRTYIICQLGPVAEKQTPTRLGRLAELARIVLRDLRHKD